LEDLTGIELLKFAATLRGVQNVDEVVDAIIACIGIEKHAKKQVLEYR
jgi:ABC-type multidrug transport system ATPase subunit